MHIVEFKSNQDFYNFVDVLRLKLKEENFLETSQQLNSILHETAYTTTSELFGDIRFALSKLKTNPSEKLSSGLCKDVDLCLENIELAFNRVNK